MFFWVAIALVSCTSTKSDEQKSAVTTLESIEVAPQEPEEDSVVVHIEEEAQRVAPAATPARSLSSSSSYSSSSSSSYSDDSDDDYWEEKRKHSPNDNYLLGFDEDVDDVHDMELYIEDY